MKLRSTFSSGILAALVAVMLVASVIGPAAAAEQLDGGVNTDADAAHNPYIEADVTKAVHEMGWTATEYEANDGDVQTLPAEVNTTAANPYQFIASDIDLEAFGEFPRDSQTQSDGDTGVVRTNGWAEDESGTAGSGTISNVTTAPNVEAVEISTSSQTTGDTYKANFDPFKITSDAEKRYVQLVLDVSTLDAGADVFIRFDDTDGDYVEAEIDPDDNYNAKGVIANSTGEGYVFQEQVGDMTVAGSGDGTMQEITEITVVVNDANAEIEIAAANVEKLGQWDFGDRMEDTDGDGNNETRTVYDINQSGQYGITDLGTMGPAFDAATLRDVEIPMRFYASMQPDREDPDTRWANISDAEAFASFDKRLDDYRRLRLPTAYDLSYANAELKDKVAVPSNRYQTVEYATNAGETDFGNLTNSDFTDATSSYGSLGDEVTLTATVTAGNYYVVHYDYPITSDEYMALTSSEATPSGGGGAPIDDGQEGFFDSFINRLMTGITGLLVALGLRRQGGN